MINLDTDYLRGSRGEEEEAPDPFALETSLAAVPEEILLNILSNLDSKADKSSLHHLMLTCRRLNNLVKPLLYQSCELRIKLWYNDGQCPILLLRTLLRNPALGNQFRDFHFQYEGALESKHMDFFSSSDWELAEKAVETISNCEIWNGWHRGNKAEWIEWEAKQLRMVLPQEIRKYWLSCLQAGRSDAVFALLLALAPGTENLTVDGWGASAIYGFSIGNVLGDDYTHDNNDFVTLILQGSANTQRAALALEEENKKRGFGGILLPNAPVLPILRSVDVRHFDNEGGMTVPEIMCFIAPPRVATARFERLAADGHWPSHIPRDVKLGLTSLTFVASSMDSGDLGCFVNCCPRLERLSYDEHLEECGSHLDASGLMPHLHSVAPTLKHLEIIGLASQLWQDLSCCGEERFSSFIAFPRLTSLHLTIDYIIGREHAHLPAEVESMLPQSLESLKIGIDGPEDLGLVVNELQNIVRSCATNCFPALKQIDIFLCYSGDHEEQPARSEATNTELELLRLLCAQRSVQLSVEE